MFMELFDKACVTLDEYYFKAGHKDDFRFLLCSRQAFHADIPVLILDKRPGKNNLGIDYPKFSCEQGNAFFYEFWRRTQNAPGLSAVQLRMQAFYADLKSCLNVDRPVTSFASKEILMAYHNPFRDDRPTDKDFLDGFWRNILDHIQPRLIFTMAGEPFKMLKSYFNEANPEKSWTDLGEIPEIQEGFDYKIYFASAKHRDRESLIVSIPSLFKYCYDKKGREQEDANKKMWSQIKSLHLGGVNG